MNELYRAFLGDGSRVAVAALAPTPEILETSLQQQPVEVAVVDAELEAAESEAIVEQWCELTRQLHSIHRPDLSVVEDEED